MIFINFEGNLGQDPVKKFTKNETPMWEFSVAVKGKTKDDGSSWYNCVCWTAYKELEWLKKGTRVLVHGYMANPSIYNSKSGEAKVRLQVDVRGIKVLSQPQSDKNSYSDKGSYNEKSTPSVFDDDLLPF